MQKLLLPKGGEKIMMIILKLIYYSDFPIALLENYQVGF